MADMLCVKCDAVLEKGKSKFEYLERVFESEVLRCPKCGQVFLSEDLVAGRIKRLEEAVEDK